MLRTTSTFATRRARTGLRLHPGGDGRLLAAALVAAAAVSASPLAARAEQPAAASAPMIDRPSPAPGSPASPGHDIAAGASTAGVEQAGRASETEDLVAPVPPVAFDPATRPAAPGGDSALLIPTAPPASPAARTGPAAVAPTAAPATSGGVDRPAALQADAGPVGLKFSGFLQSDGVLYQQSSEDEINPSTGDPLNQTRFLIRRARLRGDAAAPYVGGTLELDGNTVRGATARLVAANVSLRSERDADALPLLVATFGLFKTPFGREVAESDRARPFLERSTAEGALFPGEYDLGAMLSGGWRFLRYGVGVMNGHPIGEKAFPGRDPLAAKDLVGRVGVDTRLESVAVAVGGSFLVGKGFTPGTPATKDQLVWRDINEDNQVQTTEIQVIRGTPAMPSQQFKRSALGGDLSITVPLPQESSVQLIGELYWAQNLDRGFLVANPVSAGRALRELGYMAGVIGTVRGNYFFGVRYDRYDPDRDASELRDGAQVVRSNAVATTAFMAGARIAGFSRLIAEYDHNTNSLGRDTNGEPAVLPNDAFTLRAEVAF